MNIFEPGKWDAEFDHPPLCGKAVRVASRIGCEKLGATLSEIAPGAQSSPYHLHHANEELIIIRSGEPTLREIDGERSLQPGDTVACLTGRRGAHTLMNRTSEAAGG